MNNIPAPVEAEFDGWLDQYANAWEEQLREHFDSAQHYQAEARMSQLELVIYQAQQEAAAIPLGHSDSWEAFAAWAEAQGGELARLVINGYSDPFRGKESVEGLREALRPADIPEEARSAAKMLFDALTAHPESEGVVIVEAQEKEAVS